MAGVSKESRPPKSHFSHDVVFDGALLSNTRASLIVEVVKYLLYERQQIPLPIDHLQQLIKSPSYSHKKTPVIMMPMTERVTPIDLDLEFSLDEDSDSDRLLPSRSRRFSALRFDGSHQQWHYKTAKTDAEIMETENGQECSSSVRSTSVSEQQSSRPMQFNHKANKASKSNDSQTDVSKCRPDINFHHSSKEKLPHVKCSTHRKAKQLIEDLVKMFDEVHRAFEFCPEIEQVAILFGGTVMSPKESYLFKFPPPCPDADCLSYLSCRNTLFKYIIGEDIVGTMKSSIAPTNMMLLISAPRSCAMQYFLPKPSLRVPRTGDVISINLHCNYLVPICHDLSFVEGEISCLSGIQLLDCSLCEVEGSQWKENDTKLPCDEASVISNTGAEASGSCNDIIPTMSSSTKLVSTGDETDCVSVCESDRVCCGASPPNPVSRFCTHQRPCYIYSHWKKNRKKGAGLVDVFPTTAMSQHSTPLSAHRNGVPSDVMASKTKEHVETDYIWYQGPIVIKGYK